MPKKATSKNQAAAKAASRARAKEKKANPPAWKRNYDAAVAAYKAMKAVDRGSLSESDWHAKMSEYQNAGGVVTFEYEIAHPNSMKCCCWYHPEVPSGHGCGGCDCPQCYYDTHAPRKGDDEMLW
jgi:hypothetical protein